MKSGKEYRSIPIFLCLLPYLFTVGFTDSIQSNSGDVPTKIYKYPRFGDRSAPLILKRRGSMTGAMLSNTVTAIEINKTKSMKSKNMSELVKTATRSIAGTKAQSSVDEDPPANLPSTTKRPVLLFTKMNSKTEISSTIGIRRRLQIRHRFHSRYKRSSLLRRCFYNKFNKFMHKTYTNVKNYIASKIFDTSVTTRSRNESPVITEGLTQGKTAGSIPRPAVENSQKQACNDRTSSCDVPSLIQELTKKFVEIVMPEKTSESLPLCKEASPIEKQEKILISLESVTPIADTKIVESQTIETRSTSHHVETSTLSRRETKSKSTVHEVNPKNLPSHTKEWKGTPTEQGRTAGVPGRELTMNEGSTNSLETETSPTVITLLIEEPEAGSRMNQKQDQITKVGLTTETSVPLVVQDHTSTSSMKSTTAVESKNIPGTQEVEKETKSNFTETKKSAITKTMAEWNGSMAHEILSINLPSTMEEFRPTTSIERSEAVRCRDGTALKTMKNTNFSNPIEKATLSKTEKKDQQTPHKVSPEKLSACIEESEAISTEISRTDEIPIRALSMNKGSTIAVEPSTLAVDRLLIMDKPEVESWTNQEQGRITKTALTLKTSTPLILQEQGSTISPNPVKTAVSTKITGTETLESKNPSVLIKTTTVGISTTTAKSFTHEPLPTNVQSSMKESGSTLSLETSKAMLFRDTTPSETGKSKNLSTFIETKKLSETETDSQQTQYEESITKMSRYTKESAVTSAEIARKIQMPVEKVSIKQGSTIAFEPLTGQTFTPLLRDEPKEGSWTKLGQEKNTKTALKLETSIPPMLQEHKSTIFLQSTATVASKELTQTKTLEQKSKSVLIEKETSAITAVPELADETLQTGLRSSMKKSRPTVSLETSTAMASNDITASLMQKSEHLSDFVEMTVSSITETNHIQTPNEVWPKNLSLSTKESKATSTEIARKIGIPVQVQSTNQEPTIRHELSTSPADKPLIMDEPEVESWIIQDEDQIRKTVQTLQTTEPPILQEKASASSLKSETKSTETATIKQNNTFVLIGTTKSAITKSNKSFADETLATSFSPSINESRAAVSVEGTETVTSRDIITSQTDNSKNLSDLTDTTTSSIIEKNAEQTPNEVSAKGATLRMKESIATSTEIAKKNKIPVQALSTKGESTTVIELSTSSPNTPLLMDEREPGSWKSEEQDKITEKNQTLTTCTSSILQEQASTILLRSTTAAEFKEVTGTETQKKQISSPVTSRDIIDSETVKSDILSGIIETTSSETEENSQRTQYKKSTTNISPYNKKSQVTTTEMARKIAVSVKTVSGNQGSTTAIEPSEFPADVPLLMHDPGAVSWMNETEDQIKRIALTLKACVAPLLQEHTSTISPHSLTAVTTTKIIEIEPLIEKITPTLLGTTTSIITSTAAESSDDTTLPNNLLTSMMKSAPTLFPEIFKTVSSYGKIGSKAVKGNNASSLIKTATSSEAGRNAQQTSYEESLTTISPYIKESEITSTEMARKIEVSLETVSSKRGFTTAVEPSQFPADVPLLMHDPEARSWVNETEHQITQIALTLRACVVSLMQEHTSTISPHSPTAVTSTKTIEIDPLMKKNTPSLLGTTTSVITTTAAESLADNTLPPNLPSSMNKSASTTVPEMFKAVSSYEKIGSKTVKGKNASSLIETTTSSKTERNAHQTLDDESVTSVTTHIKKSEITSTEMAKKIEVSLETVSSNRRSTAAVEPSEFPADVPLLMHDPEGESWMNETDDQITQIALTLKACVAPLFQEHTSTISPNSPTAVTSTKTIEIDPLIKKNTPSLLGTTTSVMTTTAAESLTDNTLPPNLPSSMHKSASTTVPEIFKAVSSYEKIGSKTVKGKNASSLIETTTSSETEGNAQQTSDEESSTPYINESQITTTEMARKIEVSVETVSSHQGSTTAVDASEFPALGPLLMHDPEAGSWMNETEHQITQIALTLKACVTPLLQERTSTISPNSPTTITWTKITEEDPLIKKISPTLLETTTTLITTTAAESSADNTLPPNLPSSMNKSAHTMIPEILKAGSSYDKIGSETVKGKNTSSFIATTTSSKTERNTQQTTDEESLTSITPYMNESEITTTEMGRKIQVSVETVSSNRGSTTAVERSEFSDNGPLLMHDPEVGSWMNQTEYQITQIALTLKPCVNPLLQEHTSTISSNLPAAVTWTKITEIDPLIERFTPTLLKAATSLITTTAAESSADTTLPNNLPMSVKKSAPTMVPEILMTVSSYEKIGSDMVKSKNVSRLIESTTSSDTKTIAQQSLYEESITTISPYVKESEIATADMARKSQVSVETVSSNRGFTTVVEPSEFPVDVPSLMHDHEARSSLNETEDQITQVALTLTACIAPLLQENSSTILPNTPTAVTSTKIIEIDLLIKKTTPSLLGTTTSVITTTAAESFADNTPPPHFPSSKIKSAPTMVPETFKSVSSYDDIGSDTVQGKNTPGLIETTTSSKTERNAEQTSDEESSTGIPPYMNESEITTEMARKIQVSVKTVSSNRGFTTAVEPSEPPADIPSLMHDPEAGSWMNETKDQFTQIARTLKGCVTPLLQERTSTISPNSPAAVTWTKKTESGPLIKEFTPTFLGTTTLLITTTAAESSADPKLPKNLPTSVKESAPTMVPEILKTVSSYDKIGSEMVRSKNVSRLIESITSLETKAIGQQTSYEESSTTISPHITEMLTTEMARKFQVLVETVTSNRESTTVVEPSDLAADGPSLMHDPEAGSWMNETEDQITQIALTLKACITPLFQKRTSTISPNFPTAITWPKVTEMDPLIKKFTPTLLQTTTSLITTTAAESFAGNQLPPNLPSSMNKSAPTMVSEVYEAVSSYDKIDSETVKGMDASSLIETTAASKTEKNDQQTSEEESLTSISPHMNESEITTTETAQQIQVSVETVSSNREFTTAVEPSDSPADVPSLMHDAEAGSWMNETEDQIAQIALTLKACATPLLQERTSTISSNSPTAVTWTKITEIGPLIKKLTSTLLGTTTSSMSTTAAGSSAKTILPKNLLSSVKKSAPTMVPEIIETVSSYDKIGPEMVKSKNGSRLIESTTVSETKKIARQSSYEESISTISPYIKESEITTSAMARKIQVSVETLTSNRGVTTAVEPSEFPVDLPSLMHDPEAGSWINETEDQITQIALTLKACVAPLLQEHSSTISPDSPTAVTSTEIIEIDPLIKKTTISHLGTTRSVITTTAAELFADNTLLPNLPSFMNESAQTMVPEVFEAVPSYDKIGPDTVKGMNASSLIETITSPITDSIAQQTSNEGSLTSISPYINESEITTTEMARKIQGPVETVSSYRWFTTAVEPSKISVDAPTLMHDPVAGSWRNETEDQITRIALTLKACVAPILQEHSSTISLNSPTTVTLTKIIEIDPLIEKTPPSLLGTTTSAITTTAAESFADNTLPPNLLSSINKSSSTMVPETFKSVSSYDNIGSQTVKGMNASGLIETTAASKTEKNDQQTSEEESLTRISTHMNESEITTTEMAQEIQVSVETVSSNRGFTTAVEPSEFPGDGPLLMHDPEAGSWMNETEYQITQIELTLKACATPPLQERTSTISPNSPTAVTWTKITEIGPLIKKLTPTLLGMTTSSITTPAAGSSTETTFPKNLPSSVKKSAPTMVPEILKIVSSYDKIGSEMVESKNVSRLIESTTLSETKTIAQQSSYEESISTISPHIKESEITTSAMARKIQVSVETLTSNQGFTTAVEPSKFPADLPSLMHDPEAGSWMNETEDQITQIALTLKACVAPLLQEYSSTISPNSPTAVTSSKIIGIDPLIKKTTIRYLGTTRSVITTTAAESFADNTLLPNLPSIINKSAQTMVPETFKSVSSYDKIGSQTVKGKNTLKIIETTTSSKTDRNAQQNADEESSTSIRPFMNDSEITITEMARKIEVSVEIVSSNRGSTTAVEQSEFPADGPLLMHDPIAGSWINETEDQITQIAETLKTCVTPLLQKRTSTILPNSPTALTSTKMIEIDPLIRKTTPSLLGSTTSLISTTAAETFADNKLPPNLLSSMNKSASTMVPATFKSVSSYDKIGSQTVKGMNASGLIETTAASKTEENDQQTSEQESSTRITPHMNESEITTIKMARKIQVSVETVSSNRGFTNAVEPSEIPADGPLLMHDPEAGSWMNETEYQITQIALTLKACATPPLQERTSTISPNSPTARTWTKITEIRPLIKKLTPTLLGMTTSSKTTPAAGSSTETTFPKNLPSSVKKSAPTMVPEILKSVTSYDKIGSEMTESKNVSRLIESTTLSETETIAQQSSYEESISTISPYIKESEITTSAMARKIQVSVETLTSNQGFTTAVEPSKFPADLPSLMHDPEAGSWTNETEDQITQIALTLKACVAPLLQEHSSTISPNSPTAVTSTKIIEIDPLIKKTTIRYLGTTRSVITTTAAESFADNTLLPNLPSFTNESAQTMVPETFKSVSSYDKIGSQTVKGKNTLKIIETTTSSKTDRTAQQNSDEESSTSIRPFMNDSEITITEMARKSEVSVGTVSSNRGSTTAVEQSEFPADGPLLMHDPVAGSWINETEDQITQIAQTLKACVTPLLQERTSTILPNSPTALTSTKMINIDPLIKKTTPSLLGTTTSVITTTAAESFADNTQPPNLPSSMSKSLPPMVPEIFKAVSSYDKIGSQTVKGKNTLKIIETTTSSKTDRNAQQNADEESSTSIRPFMNDSEITITEMARKIEVSVGTVSSNRGSTTAVEPSDSPADVPSLMHDAEAGSWMNETKGQIAQIALTLKACATPLLQERTSTILPNSPTAVTWTKITEIGPLIKKLTSTLLGTTTSPMTTTAEGSSAKTILSKNLPSSVKKSAPTMVPKIMETVSSYDKIGSEMVKSKNVSRLIESTTSSETKTIAQQSLYMESSTTISSSMKQSELTTTDMARKIQMLVATVSSNRGFTTAVEPSEFPADVPLLLHDPEAGSWMNETEDRILQIALTLKACVTPLLQERTSTISPNSPTPVTWTKITEIGPPIKKFTPTLLGATTSLITTAAAESSADTTLPNNLPTTVKKSASTMVPEILKTVPSYDKIRSEMVKSKNVSRLDESTTSSETKTIDQQSSYMESSATTSPYMTQSEITTTEMARRIQVSVETVSRNQGSTTADEPSDFPADVPLLMHDPEAGSWMNETEDQITRIALTLKACVAPLLQKHISTISPHSLTAVTTTKIIEIEPLIEKITPTLLGTTTSIITSTAAESSDDTTLPNNLLTSMKKSAQTIVPEIWKAVSSYDKIGSEMVKSNNASRLMESTISFKTKTNAQQTLYEESLTTKPPYMKESEAPTTEITKKIEEPVERESINRESTTAVEPPQFVFDEPEAGFSIKQTEHRITKIAPTLEGCVSPLLQERTSPNLPNSTTAVASTKKIRMETLVIKSILDPIETTTSIITTAIESSALKTLPTNLPSSMKEAGPAPSHETFETVTPRDFRMPETPVGTLSKNQISTIAPKSLIPPADIPSLMDEPEVGSSISPIPDQITKIVLTLKSCVTPLLPERTSTVLLNYSTAVEPTTATEMDTVAKKSTPILLGTTTPATATATAHEILSTTQPSFIEGSARTILLDTPNVVICDGITASRTVKSKNLSPLIKTTQSSIAGINAQQTLYEVFPKHIPCKKKTVETPTAVARKTEMPVRTVSVNVGSTIAVERSTSPPDLPSLMDYPEAISWISQQQDQITKIALTLKTCIPPIMQEHASHDFIELCNCRRIYKNIWNGDTGGNQYISARRITKINNNNNGS